MTITERTEAEEEAERIRRKRAQWVTDMHKLVDVYLDRPDLPLPYFPGFIHCVEAIDLKDSLRALGGRREKYSNSYAFGGRRDVGQFSIRIEAPHDQVCSKVVTGHREIEKIERVGEDTRPEKTVIVQEEIVEWQCPDSIMDELDG